MKLKNILLSGLSLVLVAALAIGGTVAYLQDDDSDVNVMTLGNVKIEQHEYERVVNADGTFATDTIDNVTSYVLKDFTQAKPLLPATELDANGNPYNFGAGDWDNTLVRMSQVDSYGGMQVFDSKNAQDKFVTVENTGKTDAYVRTIIAMEIGSLTEARFDEVIKTSSFMTDQGVWKVTDIGIVEIDGNNYYIIEYVYNGAKALGGVHENGVLPAGDTTYPSLAQVYMTASATNEDVEKIDGNGNGTYDILVVSQAVQAAGFANAEAALNAGFGDITTDNHPWAGGVKIPAVVEDADGLVEALESGKDVVLNDDVKIDPAGMSNAYGTTGINVKNGQTIDGNGNTLDIKGAGGTWDSGINTTGGLIKNLTVTGSFRGIFINHNSSHSEPVVLENVIIDGTTYTISCDQGMNQNFEAYNSTFNGWTSYAATLGNAKFENCKFGEGNGYAYCRPYAPTTFVGCEFEAGYTLDPRADVTFENCTLNGVALTEANIADLVTDTAKVTVK
ncbi:MAG: hypothetical protein E7454_00590 [Ruminococcaceae bacterium]|nr:hypothetical protein [Oscillospiraceae bacterium]